MRILCAELYIRKYMQHPEGGHRAHTRLAAPGPLSPYPWQASCHLSLWPHRCFVKRQMIKKKIKV